MVLRHFYCFAMPKYNHIENIPAKVFFDILSTRDYQQLKPKPRERNLEDVFYSIYDDYFIRLDNDQAKEYLRLQNELAVLVYKLEILKSSLANHYYYPTTEANHKNYLQALKTGYGIIVDEDVEFVYEVRRILDTECGYFENDISIIRSQMKEFQKGKGKDFDFYDEVIDIANHLHGNVLVKENMTLATYVALTKSISKKLHHD